jgi:hypothetical protein
MLAYPNIWNENPRKDQIWNQDTKQNMIEETLSLMFIKLRQILQEFQKTKLLNDNR